MKKIIVTGCNGQLGRAIRAQYEGSTEYELVNTDVEDLDITNVEAVLAHVREVQPYAIINCAAYNEVDKAEKDDSQAKKVNGYAVGLLAQAALRADALLIHFSSDYVFDGNANVPYTEECAAAPLNAYGRSKLAGERNIVESGCRYMIFRTSWLYSLTGRNFFKTIASRCAECPNLKVVFDQVGTPTYALDLAQAIAVVLARFDGTQTGVYHYSNEGVCSWFDFAKMIAEYNGTSDCDVQPCHSNEFPSPVTRPSYSVLDKTKIKEVFGVSVPYWTDSLKQCISNLKR